MGRTKIILKQDLGMVSKKKKVNGIFHYPPDPPPVSGEKNNKKTKNVLRVMK